MSYFFAGELNVGILRVFLLYTLSLKQFWQMYSVSCFSNFSGFGKLGCWSSQKISVYFVFCHPVLLDLSTLCFIVSFSSLHIFYAFQSALNWPCFPCLHLDKATYFFTLFLLCLQTWFELNECDTENTTFWQCQFDQFLKMVYTFRHFWTIDGGCLVTFVITLFLNWHLLSFSPLVIQVTSPLVRCIQVLAMLFHTFNTLTDSAKIHKQS